MELTNLVSEKDDKTIVDWDELRMMRKRIGLGEISSEHYEEVKDELLHVLIEKGILTHSTNGTYGLRGPGGEYNPKFSHPASSRLCFTERKEAERYVEQFHRDTQFSIGVVKEQ